MDAIWAVNNAYKALISGHIVSESDTINIEIQRISKRSITIMKNNTLYTFELGKGILDMNYKLLPILVIILSAYIFAEPKLTLDFPPSESMTVYEPSVHSKGCIEVQINGLDIPILFDGSFEYTVKLNEDQGVNYFMIEVSDDVSTIQYQMKHYLHKIWILKKKPIISTWIKAKATQTCSIIRRC